MGGITRSSVMAAVYFNDQLGDSTVKIGHIGTERLLPAKAQTSKPFAA
jgi:hypothetical protein